MRERERKEERYTFANLPNNIGLKIIRFEVIPLRKLREEVEGRKMCFALRYHLRILDRSNLVFALCVSLYFVISRRNESNARSVSLM